MAARTANEHIGKMAAVTPQIIQCKSVSFCPASKHWKPPPRQYTTTLGNTRGQRRG
ncbi:MAG: hypothetical protein FWC34_08705 [Bacteroidetes bacterium]|nr:hypothetical protein [Bacteroidota bacterium]MCL2302355.1 hypothetical protein [Lentimicrobiaceae bacterium]